MADILKWGQWGHDGIIKGSIDKMSIDSTKKYE